MEDTDWKLLVHSLLSGSKEGILPCNHPASNARVITSDYDIESEVHCEICERAWGRWTGKEISKGYKEPKYGIKR